MKKLIILIIGGITLLSLNLGASRDLENSVFSNKYSRLTLMSSTMFKGIPKIMICTDYEFFKERIPEEYFEVFYKATIGREDLRLILYSMMLIESQYFTAYESPKNSNGTVDFGPLMLNSANLRSKDFRKKYFPKPEFWENIESKYHEENKYVEYMVACINLFEAHMKTYEKDGAKRLSNSLRAYNGGPSVLKAKEWSTKVAKTFAYSRKVTRELRKAEKEYSVYKENLISQYGEDGPYQII